MKRFTIFLSTIILSLFTVAPSYAISIGFSPSPLDVIEGHSFDVELYISDLGDGIAPSLSVFDVDVSYDASILDFNSVTYGDQLDLFGLGSITDTTPGMDTVNLYELSLDLPNDLDTMQLGTFTLATLSFDALNIGNSSLGVSINALGDSWGDMLTADVLTGSVNVAPVPEPATMFLFGTGLIGLVGFRNRSRKT